MTPEPSSQHPTGFQRFEALARRILTTPKVQLLKEAEGKARKADTKKKRR